MKKPTVPWSPYSGGDWVGLDSICQPRWTVAPRFEIDSKFKPNLN
jgi:hypothetical protein